MNWSAGYVSEIEYTYGYYRELSPSLLRFACLSAGIGSSLGERIDYLELGFGQGLSINIHAAALEGQFWGTDFNPSHAAHARALAGVAGSSAKLLDSSFAEIAARSDLPEFDVIALHGVWSWVSDENRRIIVDLIRQRLRVGGVAYLSYNCLPGWAATTPLRHIMSLHADLAGAPAGSGLVGKIDDAINFAQRLFDSGATYFVANPAVGERLKQIASQNRNYLAHEYFNRDWSIMAFAEVAQMLGEGKLSFAASAHLLDHVEAVNLTVANQELLASIAHPILRQSVRDYLVNQQFRRDIFIKGIRRLSPFEHVSTLKKQKVALATHPRDISLTVTGVREAKLQDKIYLPIIELLAEDKFAAKSLAQIATDPRMQAISWSQLVQAVTVLIGAGHLFVAGEPSHQASQRCAALNKYICEGARGASEIAYLASPVAGMGVPATRFHQLFLVAEQEGHKTPKEQGLFAWKVLDSQSQRLIKDGKTLQTVDENINELMGIATQFSEKRLPIYKALGTSLG